MLDVFTRRQTKPSGSEDATEESRAKRTQAILLEKCGHSEGGRGLTYEYLT